MRGVRVRGLEGEAESSFLLFFNFFFFEIVYTWQDEPGGWAERVR